MSFLFSEVFKNIRKHAPQITYIGMVQNKIYRACEYMHTVDILMIDLAPRTNLNKCANVFECVVVKNSFFTWHYAKRAKDGQHLIKRL